MVVGDWLLAQAYDMAQVLARASGSPKVTRNVSGPSGLAQSSPYNVAVDPEIALARELLSDSQLLVGQGRYRSAVSRGYYCAYHACIALMESVGLKPGNFLGRGGRPANRWEHGIVTANVASDRRLASVLGGAVAPQVRWLYLQRIQGDYRPERAVSRLAAHTSVNLAQQVLSQVEGHLNAPHS
jgi:hypothetical protein